MVKGYLIRFRLWAVVPADSVHVAKHLGVSTHKLRGKLMVVPILAVNLHGSSMAGGGKHLK